MAGPRVAVAYSGGLDSTALLHATVAAAIGSGVEVIALHVHHGLNPYADRWLTHCAARCRRWHALGAPLAFDHRRLVTRPARGDSVEAWARRERHAALGNMARAAGATLLLLAQHRLDQAETFLLQALRGAGPAGLSAMPRQALRDGVAWARPWLDVSRAGIDTYLRVHRLRHIDDDSNADTRFARNRLRHDVWPALARAFEHADAALADAARRAADAAQCAVDLAAIDLAAVAAVCDGSLDLTAWQALGAARRRNVLRTWLTRQTGTVAPATLVERLTAELPGAAPAQWPCGRHVLRRYRGVLRCDGAPSLLADRSDAAAAWSSEPRQEGSLSWPSWNGHLDTSPARAGGVSPERLATLRPVARSGGEQFQRTPRSSPRSLKKAFQAHGVPSWARAAPLFYDGDLLVFVPGLGVDARARASDGAPQVMLSWRSDGGGADDQ